MIDIDERRVFYQSSLVTSNIGYLLQNKMINDLFII